MTRINIDHLGDYGLVPLFPASYFIAVGLLTVSFIAAIRASRLSNVRLAVHMLLLILFLHGTVPLIFSEPRYAWVYKHLGVVNNFNLRGGVSPSVDIFQNWPGFFGTGAAFTRIAGARDPIEFAAWAQVYFNILDALAFGFVLSALTPSARKRWLGVFLFVSANWVGQDYFAPQAFSYFLCLVIFGIVLRWCATGREARWLGVAEGCAQRLVGARSTRVADDGRPAPGSGTRLLAAGVVLLLFSVVVVSHQLSPYMVVLGVGVLSGAGRVRPRWLAPVMLLLALAYLAPHFDDVNRTFGVLKAVGHPFHNFEPKRPIGQGMPGREFTADAARILSFGLWALAGAGAVRRWRARRPTAHLLVLAASPILIVLAGSYEGEAIYRIFLFALPWTAFLAVEAIAPRREGLGVASCVLPGVILLMILALFVQAYFGLDEVNQMTPAEVVAASYFYTHAPRGSVLVFADTNFPTRATANYDQHVGGTGDPLLLEARSLRGRTPGPGDLETIDSFVEGNQPNRRTPGYLVVSTSMKVVWREFGVSPPGALDALQRLLSHAPRWHTFYQNSDAVILELQPAAQRGTSG